MTITRRVTNTGNGVPTRRVDVTGLAEGATTRVNESVAASFGRRVGEEPTFTGLISSMVPDTTIHFGTSLYWDDQPIIWGKGRGQLTVRHTSRVTF